MKERTRKSFGAIAATYAALGLGSLASTAYMYSKGDMDAYLAAITVGLSLATIGMGGIFYRTGRLGETSTDTSRRHDIV